MAVQFMQIALLFLEITLRFLQAPLLFAVFTRSFLVLETLTWRFVPMGGCECCGRV
jgi:hypothetical protein